jgi:hypothetical protein
MCGDMMMMTCVVTGRRPLMAVAMPEVLNTPPKFVYTNDAFARMLRYSSVRRHVARTHARTHATLRGAALSLTRARAFSVTSGGAIQRFVEGGERARSLHEAQIRRHLRKQVTFCCVVEPELVARCARARDALNQTARCLPCLPPLVSQRAMDRG